MLTITDTLTMIFAEPVWWSYILRAFIFYFTAWILSRLSNRVVNRIIRSKWSKFWSARQAPERKAALRGLLSSAFTALVFIVATLLSLGQFIDTDTLVWMVGLFSAAFGLGARPFISDILAGITFIFEDNFGVGEKVEVQGIEGIVEEVKLRTTRLRGNEGELYIIPNGEITKIRNFSRGRFSRIVIKLKIHTTDLKQTIETLEKLSQEAVTHLPSLLEPWRVISEDGTVTGGKTEIILVAKTIYGQAATTRPHIVAFVQEALQGANVELVD